ncbi:MULTISPECIES: hypothetical protein [unclassified Streptomyces]|uniref:hypothetical protein n=1 Tax=unclassified Streptomyces TaxID=2593676 RepID=UPI0033B3458E
MVDAAPLLGIICRAIAYETSIERSTAEPSVDGCAADALTRDLARWAKASGIQMPPETPVEEHDTSTPAKQGADRGEHDGAARECATCPNGQAEPPRRICTRCQEEIRRARPWVLWGWRAGLGLTMPVAITAGKRQHCEASLREYTGYGWLCSLLPTGTQPEVLRLQVEQALTQP